jgi:hypothetical protein
MSACHREMVQPGVVLGQWWHHLDDGRIQCDLCPRECKPHEGQSRFSSTQRTQPTDGLVTLAAGFGEINLEGLNAVLAAYSPGHMLQVKWKVALYVDEQANQGQQDALTQIFSGQAGGHLAGLAPLIGEVLGVKAAPIEYRSEGKRRSLRLGDVADAEIDGMPGQDGGDVTIGNHPFTAVPGFPAVVAKSKQMRFSDYGLKWEVSNKNGFYSPFAYQSA